jgi:nitrogen regulatory protein PII
MSDETHSKKLVTIVTEAALESNLTRDVEELGAQGYTITDARGKGSRGVRGAEWDSSSSIRMEVICNSATAEAITHHLEKNYYANFSMIVFVGDVEVLRENKF